MSDQESDQKSGYSLSHIVDSATLSALLLHLPAFLPPEDVTDIIRQLQERFPVSLFDHAPDCLPDASGNALCTSVAAQLDVVQELYPARAAALYLRVLLNMLAILFEERGGLSVNDDLLRLSIDGLLRAEAVLERHCLHCPKSTHVME